MKIIKIKTPKLSLSAKCRLLSVRRSSLYYQPKPIPPADLQLLRLIDQNFLDDPSLGSRRMMVVLRRQDYAINRKKVQRLMRGLGIAAIYAKPNPIQGYHRQVRKYTKSKGAFTSENALLKLVFYAIENITKKWQTQPLQNWVLDISQLDIAFPNRLKLNMVAA